MQEETNNFVSKSTRTRRKTGSQMTARSLLRGRFHCIFHPYRKNDRGDQ